MASTEHWTDLQKNAHDRAFTVAGAMKADLLADLAAAVERALVQHGGIDKFRKEFDQIVAKHGWDYKGERNWRTRTIYKTNLLTSYASGRLAQLKNPDLLKVAPFWRYVHNDSVASPRLHHKRWGDSKLTLRHDDPFWSTHYPPNGWGCHCRVTAVARPAAGASTEPPAGWDQQDVQTGEPPGIDKGWGYQPGATVLEELQGFVNKKAEGLPPGLGNAFKNDLAAALRRPIVMAPGTDVEFAQSVRGVYNEMPSSWRDLVSEAGYPVIVTRRLTDEVPRLKGTSPAGAPPGYTWDAFDGLFLMRERKLVIAQESELFGVFSPVSIERAKGVLAHEMGHAMDVILSLSSRDNFLQSWQSEADAFRQVKLADPEAQFDQDYFLQPAPRGPMETLAELVARLQGVRTAERIDALDFFPETAKLVRSLLSEELQ